MAINKNVSEKKAGSAKKVNFFYCSGCFGTYPVGTGIFAPPNKYNLRQVCQSCYKQYIGTPKPMPSLASTALKNQFGSLMTSGGAGILSNANAGVLSNGAGGLIGNNGSMLISNKPGSLISDKSGKVLSNGAGGLISNKSSNVLSNAYGGFISDQGAGFKPK